MGNPDMPTPQHIIDKLIETVGKPRTNRYSASKGIVGLRRAQAAYYARRFGVKLNPETQSGGDAWDRRKASPTWRKRSARPATLSCARARPIPIHEFGFIISGAAIRHIPTSGGNAAAGDPHAEFLRGVERAVKHSIPRPLAVVLSYPSNPTASTADLAFYTEAVQLAKKLELIILSDLAYAEIYLRRQPATVRAAGAGRDGHDGGVYLPVKTYAMPGWRMGFAVGNERLIARAGARQILSRLRRLHARSRLRRRPRSTARRIAWTKSARPTGLAATAWSKASRAPAGPIPPPAGLDVRLGADPGSLPRRSARWSSPKC